MIKERPPLPTVLDAAVQFLVDRGLTFEDARDVIIERCLLAGDPEAFAYFEMKGHPPGKRVLRLLSVMMSQSVGPQVAQRSEFVLMPKRRSGSAGRKVDPLVEIRDELLALNVKSRMDAGESLDAACSSVAEMASGKDGLIAGRSTKYETVRKAYLQYAQRLR